MAEKNLFGDAAYFNGMPVYALYSAVIDSIAYFFPRKILEGFIFPKYPELFKNLTSFLAYKVGVLLHHLCDLQSTDLQGKVCRLLCDLAQYGKNRSEIYPHITQQEMAIALGMHRATFNRIISQLRDAGILGQVTKKRIQILDLERLVQLAEGTYAL
ncbi:MAG: Crp/Fnr family transcriptional regulator [Spirochaetales bacterium]